MLFFRAITHLLPRSKAWRVTVDKTLRRFISGLALQPATIRLYLDQIWEDAFPSTTRELAEWERQFGIEDYGDIATRQLALAGEWAATGGQSPAYIKSVLDAAGFTNIYVHEWWSSLSPVTARDPRDYTDIPTVGTYQCTGYTSGPPFAAGDALPDQPQCSPYGADEFGTAYNQPQCNRFLANDPRYLVNKTLRDVAPPPIPEDPDTWPYFLYFGAETFGDDATLNESQRARFERLILKLSPQQQWLVTMITYTQDLGVFDDTFSVEFE
jgi:hypothetical protein